MRRTRAEMDAAFERIVGQLTDEGREYALWMLRVMTAVQSDQIDRALFNLWLSQYVPKDLAELKRLIHAMQTGAWRDQARRHERKSLISIAPPWLERKAGA